MCLYKIPEMDFSENIVLNYKTEEQELKIQNEKINYSFKISELEADEFEIQLIEDSDSEDESVESEHHDNDEIDKFTLKENICIHRILKG